RRPRPRRRPHRALARRRRLPRVSLHRRAFVRAVQQVPRPCPGVPHPGARGGCVLPGAAVTAGSGLRDAASRDLERLLREVRRGVIVTPLRRASLVAAQLGHLAGRISVLEGLDAAGVAAVLETALAERAAARGPRVELVWTGPEGKSGWAQPTEAVVHDLFGQARASVLIAGYSFD